MSRVWAVLVVAAASLVYLLRLDRAAGLMVDDAWYILLARSLASGDGYRLVSSATEPIQPVVPPGFAALLAPMFVISPSFPTNLFLLKAVSIAAMAAVGAATYYYATQVRRVPASMAAAVAVATVLTPALVFLATSTVMPEAVFTLAQLLTVLAIDRAGRAGKAGKAGKAGGAGAAALAGVLAAVSVLLRSAGVAMLGAGLVYLLATRSWRRALAFSAAAAVCLVPWTAYSRAHAPTVEAAASHGGTIAYAYSDLLAMRRPGDSAAGRLGIAELPARVARNLSNVLGRDLAGVFVPAFYRGPGESGEETVGLGGAGASMGSAPATMVVSLVLAGVVTLGWITSLRSRPSAADALVLASLAMIVLVPTRTFRYLLPLAPFLWLYLASGIRAAGDRVLRTHQAGGAASVRVVMALLIALQVSDHVQFIRIKAADPVAVPWQAEARAVDDLLAWLDRALPADAAVASTNPGLVYLRTGRKGVVSADPRGRLLAWKAAGVRYIAALRPVPLPRKSFGFKKIYESGGLWVVEIPG